MDNNTEEEVWKDVVGYEGLYRISSKGNVFIIKRNSMKKPHINKGYLMVMLSKNNKKKIVPIHRLVAIAFIKNNENKPEVNHIDENKLNNSVKNLEWVTSKENANWGTRNARISEYVKANPVKSSKGVKQINPINGEVIRIYKSVTEASKINGFHQGNISSCLTGKRAKANSYEWKYVI